MFLEIWMIVVLVLTFGICAWHSTKFGFKKGAMAILQSLENDKIIVIHNDGNISPYPRNNPVFEKLMTMGMTPEKIIKKKRKRTVKEQKDDHKNI